jgi:muramoyltetrapeptide carboxypeptidase
MFADDGVDAVWCVRGGYGASRILPMLDYDHAAEAEALIGFSDITALHMAIHTQVGLVSFHGPVAWRAFTPYTLGELRRVPARRACPSRGRPSALRGARGSGRS